MLGWIIAAIVLVVILLYVTPLRIAIIYGRISENDRLTLEVSAWFRLIRLRYEFPLIRLKGSEDGPKISAKMETEKDETEKSITGPKVKKWYQNVQLMLERVHDLQPIFKKMLSRIRCVELDWHTTLGSGDAAETGALTGLVWGAKSMVVAFFSHNISFHTTPSISVEPIWNGKCIRTRFTCILQFRLGHAMVAGIRILFRMRKGREQPWQTTPSRA